MKKILFSLFLLMPIIGFSQNNGSISPSDIVGIWEYNDLAEFPEGLFDLWYNKDPNVKLPMNALDENELAVFLEEHYDDLMEESIFWFRKDFTGYEIILDTKKENNKIVLMGESLIPFIWKISGKTIVIDYNSRSRRNTQFDNVLIVDKNTITATKPFIFDDKLKIKLKRAGSK